MLIRQMDQNWIKKKKKGSAKPLWNAWNSQQTHKEGGRERETVFSQNMRPAVRLSFKLQKPKFPSKMLFRGGAEADKKKKRLRRWSFKDFYDNVRYLIIISAENCISQQWWTDSKPAKASTFSTDVSFRCFHDDGKRGETAVIKHHQSGQTMRVCE